MRTIDLRIKHTHAVLTLILDFLDSRLHACQNLISKELTFIIFDKIERLSSLKRQLKKASENSSVQFSQNLNTMQEQLEITFFDVNFIEDLMSTIENSWEYLENQYGPDIDISELKKEANIKLKCQTYSDFSFGREDVSILCLLAFEEFMKLIDSMIKTLGLIFLDPKVMSELAKTDKLVIGKGFTMFFENEKSFTLITDFYQKFTRYLQKLTDALDERNKTIKKFKSEIQEILEDEHKLIIKSDKNSIYKDFVQNKISGLLSLIQKTNHMKKLETNEHLDLITSDFLDKIVFESSKKSFQNSLNSIGFK